ncbi:MAG: type II secretion system protein [Planctomycetota bacterium]
MRRPEPSRRERNRPGFTLIELLVVVSITALLVAILLPVLGLARSTARTAQCLANQKGMLTSWSAAMADNQDRIPYILKIDLPANSHPTESWWGLLAAYNGSSQQLQYGVSAEPSNPNLCPEIDSSFFRPFYGASYFGYSVNARWTACGDLGEHKLLDWGGIKSPSAYPWFADPFVVDSGYYFTHASFGDSAITNWGLGFEHPDDSGNAVFADGHAETYQAASLEAKTRCGVPDWLLAIKPR